MARFKYVALNSKKEVVSGFVEAGDEEAVKSELHEEGLSIIDVKAAVEEESQEIKSEDNAEKHPKFEFEAENRKKQVISGLIQAEDMFHAYKELKTEHHLHVLWICTESADAETKQKEKETCATSLNERLQKEQEILSNISNMDSSDFSREIMKNIDNLDEINKDNLSVEQKKTIESIKRFNDFVRACKDTHNNFMDFCLQTLQKMYGFLFFSSLIFGLLYVAALFFDFFGSLLSEAILTDENIKFFAVFMSVGFFFATLKLYLLVNIKAFFSYLLFAFWIFSSLVLYFNI